jgi:hypothetical protein
MIPRARGMALAIVLLLLLGLSVVGLAGLGGAVADLASAAADEQAALAMQAAEAGIARTLRTGATIPAGSEAWPGVFPGLTVRSEIQFDPLEANQALLGGSFNGGDGDSLLLGHFTIRAEGRAGRAAATRIEQDYRVLWPGDGAVCGAQECPAWPSGIVTDGAIPLDIASDPVKTSWRQLDATSE